MAKPSPGESDTGRRGEKAARGSEGVVYVSDSTAQGGVAMSLQHTMRAHGRRNKELQLVPSFAKSGYNKRKWQGGPTFGGKFLPG